jgi:hypothetical protein
MAKPGPDQNGNAEVQELLRDLLITTLSTAGVKQAEIRNIVKCDINRVNRITKHIRQERSHAK